MGLLDDLAGSLGNSNGSGQGNQMQQLMAIWNWVQEQGGVEVLLQKFQQGGLGQVLNNWLGSGSNMSIDGGEIQNALGNDQLQSLADKLGTDVQGASGTLAALLPQVIDKLSPQGHIKTSNTQDLGAMVDGLFKR
ncbi:YidB family protein [Pantoea sp. X85]|uniref:YidB family protein n=1 Tax=Pantoea sp. X85 TaxID=3037258 RepID=UPI0024133457|nr:YidB family protein [Pantoea sp. X85]WFL66803.1 YidB family protein [Pantoea sp. X85]